MNIAEIIALCVSVIGGLSGLTAIVFAFKSDHKTDVKEIEQRVANETKTNMKLDEINRNVTDIKFDISATKKEVQTLSEKLVSIDSSVKSAHHRIDGVEERLNKISISDIKEE